MPTLCKRRHVLVMHDERIEKPVQNCEKCTNDMGGKQNKTTFIEPQNHKFEKLSTHIISRGKNISSS